ncbi:glycine cleavage system protein R [Angustibacter sp. McL0619]|uniref:glycine cleavage system protein R n=1 Tax=Angustibacter sp. McL0619 TaxID=3415676 RepID=UPI003CF70CCD
MSLLAVTVLGHDRPGIVADTTAALARLGGNLEDSTMTLLRGHFAMLLLVRSNAGAGEVRDALAGLAADGRLTVDVREVPDLEIGASAPAGVAYVLSVHGADRPGIVSALTGVVAGARGNVTDLSTRLTGDLYVLLAEVTLPDGADVDLLQAALRTTAEELGVDVSLRRQDTDEL